MKILNGCFLNVLLFLFASELVAQPGSLDNSFGSNGFTVTKLSDQYAAARAISLQADSKIIASGYVHTGTRLKFALIRYDTNGVIDPMFGNNGITISSIDSAESSINAMIIQMNDKIIVAGDAGDSIGNDSFNHFVLVRYEKNGNIDTSFGIQGKCETSFDSYSSIFDISYQGNDKIIAVGIMGNMFAPAGNKIALARYDTCGKIDSTFGTHGRVTTSIGNIDDGAESISVSDEGIILVGGRTYHNRGNSLVPDFALVRYNRDGTLDSSFGLGGVIITEIGIASSISKINITSENKIIASGSAYFGTKSTFAMARYNSDGSLDPSFGVAGIVTTSLGENAFLRTTLIQPDKKILCVGNAFIDSVSNFVLVRYGENGLPDPAFGDNGIVKSPYNSSSNCVFTCAVFQNDMKILTGGQADQGDSARCFAVARFISGINIGIIEPPIQNNEIFVYPNPFHQSLTIEYTLTESSPITIVVLDANNKQIEVISDMTTRKPGKHIQSIVLPSTISPGIYFLKVITNKIISKYKMIKY